MLNTTNRTSRFLFEDNCNSSKNLSSVIRVPFPKRNLTNLFKRIYSCFVFSLEDRQELIKRISLNTWTLIVVFNEILIPQDSFSRTTVTRQKIHHREFATTFPKIILFKISYFCFYFIFLLLKLWKTIVASHGMPKWLIKTKC